MKTSCLPAITALLLLLRCVECQQQVSMRERFEQSSRTFTKSRSAQTDKFKLDPEVEMNATQLIESKGIPCEKHFVTTEDGYVLGMQRLARPDSARSCPVLIVHGLLSSADGWLVNPRNESLPFLLYDAGYDVWLGNSRGNKYSRAHISLDPDRDPRYWRFSFDEMGRYDVPAMLDHVIAVSGKRQVDYVGHSQGTVVMVANGGRDGRVRNFFALAPAVYVPRMTSPLRHLAYFARPLALADDELEMGEFLPATRTLGELSVEFCVKEPTWCEDSLSWLCSTDHSSPDANLNITRLPVYASHDPSGTSARNMVHWAQLIERGTAAPVGIKQFDYGSWLGNLWHYGTATAPAYDLSRFAVPSTFVYCGEHDSLVMLDDCRALAGVLPGVQEVRVVPGYSHTDFIFAMNAPRLVYDSILEQLGKERD